MILCKNAFILRGVVLAVVLSAGLVGCAKDQRLVAGNFDFSKLRTIDWTPWQKSKPKDPVVAEPAPASGVGAPVSASGAQPMPQPALSAPRTLVLRQPAPLPPLIARAENKAQPLPPQKPFRAPNPQQKNQSLAISPASAAPAEEHPAKAPQAKVTQAEIPQAIAVLAAPAKPPRVAKPGRYSPDDLVGLDGSAIERILGKPDLSRQEPFAEVWQYTHGECVLFLFLYPSEKGPAQVSYAETGARDGGKKPDPAACIGAVAARQTGTPG